MNDTHTTLHCGRGETGGAGLRREDGRGARMMGFLSRHRRHVLLAALALLVVFGAGTGLAREEGRRDETSNARLSNGPLPGTRFDFSGGTTGISLPQSLPECGKGYEKDGALCYPKCKAGYNGVGPVCWEVCPAGYTNDGVTCRKNAHVVARESYGRGVGSALGCGSDEEKDGALCYPKCKAGYNGAGPVCWQKCPEGYTNDGATCRRPAKIIKADNSDCPGYDKCCLWKKNSGKSKCPEGQGYKNDGCTCRRPLDIIAKDSYGRGVGKVLRTCDGNEEKDGALCYPKCKAGFNGVGPVCWGTCPAGYKNDGATCRKDVVIEAKKSYGRGVGKFLRRDYDGIFFRYIRDHHNMYFFRGKPLREDEKTYLKQFFPARLVDGVRVVEEVTSSGAFSHKASATTYGNDLIVFNKNKAGNRSLKLLKHEFVHICQYDVLGIKGFASEYANGYVDGDYEYSGIPMEQDADQYEERPDATTPVVGKTMGWRMAQITQCK